MRPPAPPLQKIVRTHADAPCGTHVMITLQKIVSTHAEREKPPILPVFKCTLWHKETVATVQSTCMCWVVFSSLQKKVASLASDPIARHHCLYVCVWKGAGPLTSLAPIRQKCMLPFSVAQTLLIQRCLQVNSANLLHGKAWAPNGTPKMLRKIYQLGASSECAAIQRSFQVNSANLLHGKVWASKLSTRNA